MHLHVVDEDAGAVEGPDRRGGDTLSIEDGGAETTSVMADVGLTLEQGLEGQDGLRPRRAQGHLEPRRPRLRLQLLRRAAGDDPPVVKDRDLVREVVGLVEVLGGEKHGAAVPDHPADHLPDPEPAGRVETGGRLVEEEDGRRHHHAGREVEAPAHAAGVPLGLTVGGVAQFQPLQQGGGPLPRRGAPEPAQLADHLEVLPAGEQLVEGGRLGGHPDPPPHLGRLGGDIEARDRRTPLVRMAQGGEDPDRRGLAGAVGPQHAEDRACRDGEVDAGQSDGRAVALDQSLRLDHGPDGHVRPPESIGARWGWPRLWFRSCGVPSVRLVGDMVTIYRDSSQCKHSPGSSRRGSQPPSCGTAILTNRMVSVELIGRPVNKS